MNQCKNVDISPAFRGICLYGLGIRQSLRRRHVTRGMIGAVIGRRMGGIRLLKTELHQAFAGSSFQVCYESQSERSLFDLISAIHMLPPRISRLH